LNTWKDKGGKTMKQFKENISEHNRRGIRKWGSSGVAITRPFPKTFWRPARCI